MCGGKTKIPVPPVVDDVISTVESGVKSIPKAAEDLGKGVVDTTAGFVETALKHNPVAEFITGVIEGTSGAAVGGAAAGLGDAITGSDDPASPTNLAGDEQDGATEEELASKSNPLGGGVSMAMKRSMLDGRGIGPSILTGIEGLKTKANKKKTMLGA